MADGIKSTDLVEKCKRFIQSDPTSGAMEYLIRDALITADREIRKLDQPTPLAWMRETYNELFTRPYASISAVTQANPGVITAESSDSDVSGHGFIEDDIVRIGGIGGMERLNERVYRNAYIDADTLSLKQFDDQNDIVTTNYDAYVSGGGIYHAGILIPNSTFEPSGTSYDWKMKRIFGVTFDLYPSDPISEEAILQNPGWLTALGRPTKWRHLRYNYGDPTSITHILLFYPPTSQRYNIAIAFEKDHPDLTFPSSSPPYPPHPAEVHDAIWHRALFNLSTNAERAKRESSNGTRMMGMVEVQFAKLWMQKTFEDELMIINLSRSLLGDRASSGPGGGVAA